MHARNIRILYAKNYEDQLKLLSVVAEESQCTCFETHGIAAITTCYANNV